MEVTKDKVQYISYEDLSSPSFKQISQSVIELGFSSKDWAVHFQTITNLRQANKFYSVIFIKELIPRFYTNIIGQVENLRSNNSKQALTLLSQIFQHQSLDKLDPQMIKPIVACLFVKSVSQKSFLKNQAMKAINCIPKNWNEGILQELISQTKSLNGTISQLAIKIMSEMIEQNKYSDVDSRFLKALSFNINGKRAFIQKQAKQMLTNLKKRIGEQNIEKIINNSTDLDEEQTNTLKRELKKETEVNVKSGNNFRDFMKMKKNQAQTTV